MCDLLRMLDFIFNIPFEYNLLLYVCGAGDETRTRDNLLGRQGLYQLSYSRICYVKQLFVWQPCIIGGKDLTPQPHCPRLSKKRQEPLACFLEKVQQT